MDDLECRFSDVRKLGFHFVEVETVVRESGINCIDVLIVVRNQNLFEHADCGRKVKLMNLEYIEVVTYNWIASFILIFKSITNQYWIREVVFLPPFLGTFR